MEALDLRLRGLHEPRDVAPFIFLGGGDAAKREDLTFGGKYSNLTAPQYIFVFDIFMELSFHIRIVIKAVLIVINIVLKIILATTQLLLVTSYHVSCRIN